MRFPIFGGVESPDVSSARGMRITSDSCGHAEVHAPWADTGRAVTEGLDSTKLVCRLVTKSGNRPVGRGKFARAFFRAGD